MSKKIFRVSLFIIISAILIMSASCYVCAVVIDNPQTKGPPSIDNEDNKSLPEHAPGEILVKFKEGVDPQSVISSCDIQTSDIKRVHSIKPAVVKFRKDYKLEKTEGGWYSFLGKNYKEVADIPDDIMFKKAYEKMPDIEKAIYRSYKIKLPDGVTIEEAIAKLKDNPNVEYVQPNNIVSMQDDPTPLPDLAYIPNDYYVKDNQYWRQGSWAQSYPDMWGLRSTRAIEAFNIFDTNRNGVLDAGEKAPGEDVVVAVIDSGVDYNHEDLSANIWINTGEIPGDGIDNDHNGYIDDVRGYDFSDNDNDPSDYYGHGTHVAGTIAAVGNNTIGVIGISPKAKIMSVKIFPSGESDVCARAIIYAADNGAQVLSNSWGFRYRNPSDPEIETAIDYAYSRGCVIVFSAGNRNDDMAYYSPANHPKTISVAASDHNDEKASFSNWGNLVDISAPGVDVLSLRAAGTDMYDDGSRFVPLGDTGAKYYTSDGTSMACPHVSGLAALIKSLYPAASQAEIRGRIAAGADNIDSKNPLFQGLLGTGRANIHNSLTISPGPLFKLMSIEKRNVLPGSDGTIVFSVKNLWLDAMTVTAALSTPDSRVLIQNNNIALGDILSGQAKTNSDNPFVVNLGQGIVFGDVINFSLTLRCQGGYEKVFNFSVELNFFTDTGRETALPLDDPSPKLAIMCDYDNDSFGDIFFIGRYAANLYKNCRNGSFVNVTKEAGLDVGTLRESAYSSVFMDINNDGNTDLFIGIANYIRNQLFLSKGDGTFTNITDPSGVRDMRCQVMAAVFDYDNDGFIDIFGSKYPSGLFVLRNNGNNTFTDQAQETGLSAAEGYLRFSQGVSFDYDSDNDQDLLFSSCGGFSGSDVRLYRNNGGGTFTDVTLRAGIAQRGGGYRGAAAGDYDNDGHIDIFLIGSSAPDGSSANVLYRNNGDGTFTDVTAEAISFDNGVAGGLYGTAFFDYDNDGNLDLFMNDSSIDKKGDRIYRNNGDRTFSDVTNCAFPPGVKSSYAPACIGDYNNDGALDIYTPTEKNSGTGAFLKNAIGVNNHWVKVKLAGTISNRDAYGAKVYVKTGGRIQLREVHFGAVQAQPVHFGMGDANVIDEIEVRWPSGVVQKLNALTADRVIEITEPAITMPVITSINPSSASVGDPVTVTGRNFQTAQDTVSVEFFNGCAAQVISRSETQIVCAVPNGTSSGNVHVTTNQGRSNGIHFIPLIIPAAPFGLSAVALPLNKAQLTWHGNTYNEDGFKIERSLSPNDGYSQIAVINMPNVTNYTDSGLMAVTNYYYRVRAYATGVGDSAYSNVAEVTTLVGPPLAPTSLQATALSPTTIKLDWVDNSNNEYGFRIERIVGTSGIFTERATVGANAATFTDTDLVPNQGYIYQVCAVNSLGVSDYTDVVIIWTPDYPPAAPSDLTAATTSRFSVRLSWTDNSDNESGFIIEQSRSPDSGFTQIAKTHTSNVATYNYQNVDFEQEAIYYYRICAWSYGSQDSTYSNVAAAATPPNRPAGLSATGISCSQMELNWQDNSASETGFKIHRGGVEIANVGANIATYTDEGLNPDTLYSYQVLAYNDNGSSDYSNTAFGATLASKPAAPSNLAAATVPSISIVIARLTWQDNSDNETWFKIERSLSPASDFILVRQVRANTTSYDDSGPLSADTRYYYRVYAYNGVNSNYSNAAEVTTPPARPFPLYATAVSSSELRLNWQDNSGNETGFKILRGATYSGAFTEIATVSADVTTYTDTGLAANTRYYYRVRSYNINGDSTASNSANATMLKIKPVAPSNLTASVASLSQVNLSWQDNSDNEEGFSIERKQGIDGEFAQVATTSSNISAYSDTDLSPDSRYFYKIRAHNNGGDSEYSNIVSVALYIPPAPSDLTAAAVSPNQIDLSWQDNSDNETAFLIEQGPGSSGPFTVIATVNADTVTYYNAGLSVNVTYYYRVRSTNGLGSSSYSNTANATTPQPVPPAPSNLTVEPVLGDRHQLRLRWRDNAGNEDGFKIERSLTGQENDFTQIAEAGPNTSTTIPSFVTHADTGLSSGTTYYYRVRAYNSTGDSAYTNIANRATPVNNSPTITIDPPGDKVVDENQKLTFMIIIADPDSEDRPQLLPTNLPDGATLTPGKRNVVFEWTPNYTQAGVYPLTFTVSDGEFTASVPVRITVNNVNRPPVITIDPPGDKTINEGHSLTFNVNYSDPDGDPIRSSTVYGMPEGATLDAGGRFSWTPTYDQAGNYTVTFQYSDGDLSDSKTVNITVNNVNRPPNLSPIGNQAVDEGKALTFTVTGTDPDNDKLTYSSSGLPAGATLDPDTGVFNWKPTYYQAGNYSVTFTVSDGLASASESITITVKNVNGPPEIAPIGNKTVNRHELLKFKIHAVDPDNDLIVYSVMEKPFHAYFNPRTAEFRWRPLMSQAGDFAVTFVAMDIYGHRSLEKIIITVPNQSPVLNPIGDKTVSAGRSLRFHITANDPDLLDQRHLRFYADNLPVGAHLLPNGMFIWTPRKSQRGTCKVRLYVKDPPGLIDDEIITITVK